MLWAESFKKKLFNGILRYTTNNMASEKVNTSCSQVAYDETYIIPMVARKFGKTPNIIWQVKK